jgi:NAD(P)-dependent dehydrogenase (short-subunit alcohol dehydrogenase family)
MADKVVDEIKAAGGQAVANYDNVASVAGGERIVKSALDAFGQLDICVNNAGILRDKTLAKLTEDFWDPVVDVHLKGTYCVSRPAFNHMKERGQGGVIINTSSTSGLNGNFGQSNYGAAKAGIWGFSRCLALEGQRNAIRVYILAPVALTRLTEDLAGMQAGEMKEKLDPALVSPLVVYLASELAKDQTGTTFFVGGGRIAEMRMVTAKGVTKTDDGGLFTAEEIAARMSEILLPG